MTIYIIGNESFLNNFIPVISAQANTNPVMSNIIIQPINHFNSFSPALSADSSMNLYFIQSSINNNYEADQLLANIKMIYLYDPRAYIVIVNPSNQILKLITDTGVEISCLLNSEHINFIRILNNILSDAYTKCDNYVSHSSEEFFEYTSKRNKYIVPCNQIMFFESIKGTHKTRMKLVNDSKEIHYSLKELEDMLSSNLFTKVSRSLIINKKFLYEYNVTDSKLELTTGEKFNISRPLCFEL